MRIKIYKVFNYLHRRKDVFLTRLSWSSMDRRGRSRQDYGRPGHHSSHRSHHIPDPKYNPWSPNGQPIPNDRSRSRDNPRHGETERGSGSGSGSTRSRFNPQGRVNRSETSERNVSARQNSHQSSIAVKVEPFLMKGEKESRSGTGLKSQVKVVYLLF